MPACTCTQYTAYIFFQPKQTTLFVCFVIITIKCKLISYSIFLSLSLPAELAATEKFKHADVLLQSLRLPPYHASSLSPSHVHHSPPPSSPTTEPMYDNIEDKKKPRIQAVNIQATLPEIQPCPAYSVPPALPPPIHRPNIGNMQQQGLYIERD